jgi:hypothetical protein
MAGQFDRKADDWVLAAHIMLIKTTNNQSGVAFKLGSPSLKVAAQVSILGSISGSNIPTSLDYVSLSSVFLRNFTGKPFSVHDINGLRGGLSQGTRFSAGGPAEILPFATRRGGPAVFWNAQIDAGGDPSEFEISGQWVLRKVLNFSETFVT